MATRQLNNNDQLGFVMWKIMSGLRFLVMCVWSSFSWEDWVALLVGSFEAAWLYAVLVSAILHLTSILWWHLQATGLLGPSVRGQMKFWAGSTTSGGYVRATWQIVVITLQFGSFLWPSVTLSKLISYCQTSHKLAFRKWKERTFGSIFERFGDI